MKKIIMFGESANSSTGISRYIRAITKGIQNSDVDFDYTVAVRSLREVPNLDKMDVKYKTNFLKGKLQDIVRRLPTGDSILFGQSDVVHEPNFNLSKVSSNTKIVLTVHDVGWRLDKTPYGLTQTVIDKAENAIRLTAKIITPTETVKSDVVRFFNYDPKNITVIPHGIEPVFLTEEVQTLTVKLPEDYWLFVGALTARKNIERAIQTIASMDNKLPLVIAGDRTSYAEKMVKDAENLGVRVIIISGTSDSEIKTIYCNSIGLIYPSLWEGFGLPILEAASVGTPIITSNNTAMKEISKDYSFLVDPYKSTDIRQAMDSVLDLSIEDREQLKLKGQELIKPYCWEKSVEAHKSFYQNV